MRYKNIICKYCGKPATVSTLRKADYCDDCKQLAHNEVSRICYKKNVSTNEVMYNRTNNVRQNNYSNERVVARKVSSDGANNMYVDELMNIAEDYDKLRLRAINLYKKAKAEEEYLTKSGDMFVHKLEFDNMTDKEKLEYADQVEKDRKIRRGRKLSKDTALEIVSAFDMRSARKFVNEAIKGAKSTRDFRSFLDNLKSDKEIYAEKKSPKSKEVQARKDG